MVKVAEFNFSEPFGRAKQAHTARDYDRVILLCSDLLAASELTIHQRILVLELRGRTYSRMGQRWYPLSENDLKNAIRLAELSTNADYVFALTTLYRLNIIERREWNALHALQQAERRLKQQDTDQENVVKLLASLQSLEGVYWTHQGRRDRAWAMFSRAQTKLQSLEHPDYVRLLRNYRRTAFMYARFGMRIKAWRYASYVISLGKKLGDPHSVSVGRVIHLAFFLPFPLTRLVLRLIRVRAGH